MPYFLSPEFHRAEAPYSRSVYDGTRKSRNPIPVSRLFYQRRLRYLQPPAKWAATDRASSVPRVREVAPRRTYFTHMSDGAGLHSESHSFLPDGVEFAYDTLRAESRYNSYLSILEETGDGASDKYRKPY